MIFYMQGSAFVDDDYQGLKNSMINEVHWQITSLSVDRIDVKLKRKYVEKYKSKDVFTFLSKHDKADVIENIAGLVTMSDKDDTAMEFDNIIYGLMLAQLEGEKGFTRFKNTTISKATILLNKTTIPQVKAKIPVLKEVVEEEFWDAVDMLNFERIRLELRELMKFSVTDAPRTIYTNLVDVEKDRIVGREFELNYDFEDYKLKVNRYIEENKNNIAIHKLRNNIPLSEADYKILEKVFTGELGTREDYVSSFQGTPFGLLVSKIAKVERDAALKAFSSFINEGNLNADQIVFVNKVIDYIEKNGFIENVTELTKAPFDEPKSFIKLFDTSKQKKLVQILNQVKNNAIETIG